MNPFFLSNDISSTPSVLSDSSSQRDNKIWVDVRRIKQQNECFEVYRIPPRVKGKDGKTEAKSVYLFRKKDQHGHWVRWMSTIGKNGLMS